MKLEGVFLGSRLGRRIFILFVLAATVPIMLLGALAYSGWTSHTAAQDKDRPTRATRYVAMTVPDCLLVARLALQLTALDASSGAMDERQRGMLRSVSVSVEPGPAVPGGVAQLAAAAAGRAEPPAAGRGLYWMRRAGEGAAGRDVAQEARGAPAAGGSQARTLVLPSLVS